MFIRHSTSINLVFVFTDFQPFNIFFFLFSFRNSSLSRTFQGLPTLSLNKSFRLKVSYTFTARFYDPCASRKSLKEENLILFFRQN